MMLKREHIEEFIRFCFNPPKAWIDTKNVSRFKSKDGLRVSNSDWHPYVVAISKSDIKTGKLSDTKDFCPSQSSIKTMNT